jgi:hypothetical protein
MEATNDPREENERTRALRRAVDRSEASLLEAINPVGSGDFVDYREIALLANKLAHIVDTLTAYVADAPVGEQLRSRGFGDRCGLASGGTFGGPGSASRQPSHYESAIK